MLWHLTIGIEKKSSMSDLQGHWDHLALLKITSGEPRFGESKRGLTLAGAPRWTGECYGAGHWPWTMANFFSQKKTWRPDLILQPMLPLLFWTTLSTTASPSKHFKQEILFIKKKEKSINFQLKYFLVILLLNLVTGKRDIRMEAPHWPNRWTHAITTNHHLASFKKAASKITPLSLLYSALCSIYCKGNSE